MEFTLLWAALTGVALLWVGTRIWPEGLPDHAFDKLLGAAVVGLFVGRLTAMIVQGTNPLTHPGDILIVRGGVDTVAATVSALLAYSWSVKGRLSLLDASAAASLLGLAGWHAGCLWRNACLGVASDLPWAWSIEGSDVTRHPVEIYAALALFGAAFLVARLPHRLALRAGAGLAFASLVRLATEPLRLTVTGGSAAWYAVGLVLGVGLIASGPWLGRRFPSTAT